MNRIPKPAAGKAVPSGETDAWSELEKSVNLATGCIHLLAEFAAREIDSRCGRNLRAEVAGDVSTGIALIGHDVIVRLHHAYLSAHEAVHRRGTRAIRP